MNGHTGIDWVYGPKDINHIMIEDLGMRLFRLKVLRWIRLIVIYVKRDRSNYW